MEALQALLGDHELSIRLREQDYALGWDR